MNRGKSRQILSTKQLFAILISGILGHGFISISRITVTEARQDGWISIILAGMVALLGVNIILFFMKHFPGKTVIEASEQILGKYLGKIPAILVFVYYLALSSLSLRVLADLSSTWLLPETPIEIIMLSILGILIYLTRNGVKVLGRFNQMIVWILVPVIPLIFVPFFEYGTLLNILPVGTYGLMPIIKGAIPVMYAFLGFESLLILYPYVREDTSHIEIVKISNLAVVLVIGIKAFAVFSNIAIFGPNEIDFLLYPMLDYFRLVVFPVIERVEFVLIFYWLFIFFGSIALYFYMTNLTIEQIFKITGYKNTGVFLIIPMYYLTRVPQNASEVFDYINLIGTFGPPLIFLVIFTLFVGALIRGRGKFDEA